MSDYIEVQISRVGWRKHTGKVYVNDKLQYFCAGRFRSVVNQCTTWCVRNHYGS